ncbi:MAG: hypothetical protein Q4B52_03455 [Tissierellia bacterium]|nr:hypothetical protein [Tissierellia bacterium]
MPIYKVFGYKEFSKNTSVLYNYGTLAFIISTIAFYFINTRFNIDYLIIFTIIANSIAFVFSLLLKEDRDKEASVENIKFNELRLIYKNKYFLKLVFISSFFGLSFILINFFYVQILIDNGYNENLISAIILIYSFLQLSQRIIISILDKRSIQKNVQLLSLILSIFLIVLFILRSKYIVIAMILFPTFLSVMGIYLERIQNNFIDNYKLHEYRATMLSAFNLFSDIFEVIFLVLNSMIASLNYRYVFFFLGIMFLISMKIDLKTKSFT